MLPRPPRSGGRGRGSVCTMLHFTGGDIVLADRVVPGGSATAVHGIITAVGGPAPAGATVVELGGGYLLPGFVDIHVHGGDGSDFRDLTAEAFRPVCRCHARHGTTSLLPTSTAARPDQTLRFLELTRQLM